MSGDKATRTPDASRLPGVSEPREASGLRRVHRRFFRYATSWQDIKAEPSPWLETGHSEGQQGWLADLWGDFMGKPQAGLSALRLLFREVLKEQGVK